MQPATHIKAGATGLIEAVRIMSEQALFICQYPNNNHFERQWDVKKRGLSSRPSCAAGDLCQADAGYAHDVHVISCAQCRHLEVGGRVFHKGHAHF